MNNTLMNLGLKFEILEHPILLNGKPLTDDIKVINDWGDFDNSVIAITNEHGLAAIATGDSEQSAYDAWIDEEPTISADDQHEAYGFDSAEEWAENDAEGCDLVEGYVYQGNFQGTGIVNVGHETRTHILR